MQLSLGTLSRLTHLIRGGIRPWGKTLVPRVLALLAVLLLPAVAHATPARAANFTGYCGGTACLNFAVTMADGSAVPSSVPPADDANEPEADVQVKLVAATNSPLTLNWLHLQIVDLNGNVYADCGTATAPPCQVYLWTDEDGRLHFNGNPWPSNATVAPYGPDGHTIQFACRIWDTVNTTIVGQVAVPVVFDNGDDGEPEGD